eukprot:31557-Pelagococcus_subviridis.AAC.3
MYEGRKPWTSITPKQCRARALDDFSAAHDASRLEMGADAQMRCSEYAREMILTENAALRRTRATSI